jgi:hypothetical protein
MEGVILGYRAMEKRKKTESGKILDFSLPFVIFSLVVNYTYALY